MCVSACSMLGLSCLNYGPDNQVRRWSLQSHHMGSICRRVSYSELQLENMLVYWLENRCRICASTSGSKWWKDEAAIIQSCNYQFNISPFAVQIQRPHPGSEEFKLSLNRSELFPAVIQRRRSSNEVLLKLISRIFHWRPSKLYRCHRYHGLPESSRCQHPSNSQHPN